jgi:hypothetical protein
MLDVVITQIILQQPDDAFIAAADEEGELSTVRHFMKHLKP